MEIGMPLIPTTDGDVVADGDGPIADGDLPATDGDDSSKPPTGGSGGGGGCQSTGNGGALFLGMIIFFGLALSEGERRYGRNRFSAHRAEPKLEFSPHFGLEKIGV